MKNFKLEDRLKKISKEITYITEKGILFNKSVETFDDPYIETQVFLSFDEILKIAEEIKKFQKELV